jgi:hypothetical protein
MFVVSLRQVELSEARLALNAVIASPELVEGRGNLVFSCIHRTNRQDCRVACAKRVLEAYEQRAPRNDSAGIHAQHQ